MTSPWATLAPGRYVPPVDRTPKLLAALRAILAVEREQPTAKRVRTMRMIAKMALK